MSDLEIGAKVASDVGRIALRENGDLLLDVFYLIVCCLQVNDLDGYHSTTSLVNTERGRERERERDMRGKESKREDTKKLSTSENKVG